MPDKDYGPKTGAGADHPYDDPAAQRQPPAPPVGKDRSTPPDGRTEVDSEADLERPA